jgi:hypothetical protein
MAGADAPAGAGATFATTRAPPEYLMTPAEWMARALALARALEDGRPDPLARSTARERARASRYRALRFAMLQHLERVPPLEDDTPRLFGPGPTIGV